jgi:hypothetical protein
MEKQNACHSQATENIAVAHVEAPDYSEISEISGSNGVAMVAYGIESTLN